MEKDSNYRESKYFRDGIDYYQSVSIVGTVPTHVLDY